MASVELTLDLAAYRIRLIELAPRGASRVSVNLRYSSVLSGRTGNTSSAAGRDRQTRHAPFSDEPAIGGHDSASDGSSTVRRNDYAEVTGSNRGDDHAEPGLLQRSRSQRAADTFERLLLEHFPGRCTSPTVFGAGSVLKNCSTAVNSSLGLISYEHCRSFRAAWELGNALSYATCVREHRTPRRLQPSRSKCVATNES